MRVMEAVKGARKTLLTRRYLAEFTATPVADNVLNREVAHRGGRSSIEP